MPETAESPMITAPVEWWRLAVLGAHGGTRSRQSRIDERKAGSTMDAISPGFDQSRSNARRIIVYDWLISRT